MINTATVFVLGAGASVPYGFPTGARLLEMARGVDVRGLMGNAGQQVTQRAADLFRQAVEDNMLASIDSMLEHRQDLVSVGKKVMAFLLYQRERIAGPGPSDEDWMALIFQRMAEGAPDLNTFSRNAVTFVTFNYDRYLEYRFIRGLISRYGNNILPYQAWAAIADKFVHLHGSLGDLPEFSEAVNQPNNLVPLGAPETNDVYFLGPALNVVEQTIRIVHDDVQTDDSAFVQARTRLSAAEQVFFLGFGFGKKNVERLSTASIPTAGIHCTTYQMTTAEVIEALSLAFPRKETRHLAADSTIRPFLRERILTLR